MLSSNLQAILNNRLRYLPEITAKAITSIDWSTKVIEIGHKYGLHMDEIEELQGVVLKSMTGLADPADFETNLINATAASPATIEHLIEALNHAIFEPIHDFVMNNGKAPDPLKAQGIELEHDIPEAAPVPTPKPVVQSAQELELPSNSQTVKPAVPGNFNEFFIKPPTTTDHSMVK